MELNLRRIPEKFKSEGVFGYNQGLICIGDSVEAVRNVQGGLVPLGTRTKVADILVEPNGNVRGFTKRLMLEGFPGEFNPKRFRKIEPTV